MTGFKIILDNITNLIISTSAKKFKNNSRQRTIFHNKLMTTETGSTREKNKMNKFQLIDLVDKHKNKEDGSPLLISEQNLSNLDLTDLDLSKIHFVKCDFKDSLFKRINLNKSHFIECDLTEAILVHCNLSQSYISKCKFIEADIKYCNLSSSNLLNSNFYKADLYRSDMTDAYAVESDFTDSCMVSVNLANCYLFDSNISTADLFNCKHDNQTTFPDNVIILEGYQYKIFIHKATNRILDNYQVGCKNYTVEEWLSMTNEELIWMDGRDAVKFYPELLDLISYFSKVAKL